MHHPGSAKWDCKVPRNVVLGNQRVISLRVAWTVRIFLNENACYILGRKGLITICHLLFSSVQGWQRAAKYFKTGWASRDSSACSCSRTCAGTWAAHAPAVEVVGEVPDFIVPSFKNQWLLLTFHKSWKHRRKILDVPVHTGNYWQLAASGSDQGRRMIWIVPLSC